MMTLGTMELERELTGEIQSDRNFLFFSRRRVGIRQTLKHLPVDELTKEISLHRFSHMFQVIDLAAAKSRSEEHTSELQSPYDLVCRLLLEKKKIHNRTFH